MSDGQPGASRETGLLALLRKLAATAAELLHTRLRLLAVELEEERARLFRVLVLSVIAGFFLVLGVITLTFFVILLAWDTHRLLAAGLLTAAYVGIGVICALNARSLAGARSKLFSASLAELRKDRDELG